MLAEGLAESRSRARALIMAGEVLVDDEPVDKAGAQVRDDAEIRLRKRRSRGSYVSRGGDKLAGALDDLGIDPAGLRCLDLGASTGGFTDCLLRAGAAHVVAVDVGYGQLHPKLRADPRVLAVERTNARTLEASVLPAPVALVAIDASFISLRLLLPAVARVAPGALIVALVKPQFEVGREQVGKGGVVRDDGLREQAVRGVAEAATLMGYRLEGRADSRLAGPKGNREVFLALVPVEGWRRPVEGPLC